MTDYTRPLLASDDESEERGDEAPVEAPTPAEDGDEEPDSEDVGFELLEEDEEEEGA